MDDLESKLNSILSSPDEMARIMSIARSFSGTLGMDAPEEEAAPAPAAEPAAGGFSFDALDPKLLRLMSSVMQAGSQPDDKQALLAAMSPYLKKERRDKMAQALQFARMARIVKEIFRENGGEL